jgi:glycosyltransferase involved in cell wall biosynthesis
VHFTGALPHADALRRIARADLFVLPSRAEGMPVALLEAMAAGTAAIATRVGAIPEIARDNQEAVLIDALDPAEMAKAMKLLLENPDRRAELGRAAAERVQREFCPERFRSALAELWTAVATPESPRCAELPRLATSAYRSIL